MELHAFERMAQALDPSLMPEDSECHETELQPQPTGIFPPVTPPAMAYVPYQQWGATYDAETGLQKGTIFPALDFPLEIHGTEGGSAE
jgi:hypothetical protein